jgi:muconolactone D-isomerase
MDVRPPHGIDPADFDRLKAEEKTRAEDLQRQGTWVHLWRITGQYANISIFDAETRKSLAASFINAGSEV